MTLEVHEDTEGRLSTWRDPYEWVDPFSEAEEWALRWARACQAHHAEEADFHRSYRREIAHLNAIVERYQSFVETLGPLQNRNLERNT